MIERKLTEPDKITDEWTEELSLWIFLTFGLFWLALTATVIAI